MWMDPGNHFHRFTRETAFPPLRPEESLYLLLRTHAELLTSRPAAKPSNFLQYLQQAEAGEKWCLASMNLPDDGSILAHAISQGEAITISDGSFQDTYGTAAWVIEGCDSKGRMKGAVIVSGTAQDQSAYRSELAGIYSILIMVKKICEFFDIQQGAIELGCDGQSALDKAFNYVSIIRLDDANHDLLQAIRTLWASSPIQWKFRHVKGHQDDHKSASELDRWATLNVEMDTAAKQHMHIAKRSPRHFLVANEPWSVWCNGQKITSNFTETIYDLVHSDDAKTYWSKKDEITTGAIDDVDWEAINKAMIETRRPRRVFITKHACGMCGVGKFMKRWKQRQDSACPRCGEMEDAANVWTCHGAGADDLWESSVEALEGWLNRMHTDPDIQHCILSYLRSWRYNTEPNIQNHFLLTRVLGSQNTIGWTRFLEGWISHEWTKAQQAYYTSIKSLRTGKRWAIALIKKLWDIAWDLWEHRNGILHESCNVVSQNELHILDRKIKDVFGRLQSIVLSANDKHLISLNLPRLLKKDSIYKEMWLANAETVSAGRCHSQWTRRHSQATLIRGMQQCMRQCMQIRNSW